MFKVVLIALFSGVLSNVMAITPPQSRVTEQTVHSAYDVEKYAKANTWVFLDVDQTLLRSPQTQPVSEVFDLAPRVKELLDRHPVNQYTKDSAKFFILTARESTQPDLEKIGISITKNVTGIIVAPTDRSTGNRIVQKGHVLRDMITKAQGYLPQTIVVVDDSQEQFDSIKAALTDEFLAQNNIKLILLLKSQVLYQSATSGDFPDTYTDYTVGQHLSGGSGGVHTLVNKDGQTQFTVKCGDHLDHFKEEMLADALYRTVGVKVPAFQVLSELPATIVKNIGQCGTSPLYRVAQYIPADKSGPDDLAAGFVADALFSNWDIVFSTNFIHAQNGVWRIDNGGALRFRAASGQKKVDGQTFDGKTYKANEVLELNTLRSPVYQGLTDEMIKSQATDLIAKREAILKTIRTVGQALNIDDFSEVSDMMNHRLDWLAEHVLGKPGHRDPMFSNTKLKVGSIPMGAGVTIWSCIVDETKPYPDSRVNIMPPCQTEPMILLGQHRGHEWWGNFGGKAEDHQSDAAQVAVDEVREESMGLNTFTAEELNKRPSHDLITTGSDGKLKFIFRNYTAYGTYVPVSKYMEALTQQSEDHSKEYTGFAWVPIRSVLEALNTPPADYTDKGQYGTVKTVWVTLPKTLTYNEWHWNGDKPKTDPRIQSNSRFPPLDVAADQVKIPLHVDLYRSLMEPPAKQTLQLILAGKIPPAAHTQSHSDWNQESATNKLKPQPKVRIRQ